MSKSPFGNRLGLWIADCGLWIAEGTNPKSSIRNPQSLSFERRSKTQVRGFTLVEVIIVAGLFLVIAGALLTTFLTGRTSYLSSDAFILVQQEARRAFDLMVRELREASPSGACAANVTNGGLQLNFQVAQGYNQAGCPNAVCCAGGNCSNAICWGSEVAGNPWVHYALVDGDGNAATGNDHQLVRCVNSDPAGNIVSAAGCRVLANYVQTVTFAYAQPIVTVNLQIRYSNPALPTTETSGPLLTTRVKLRNP